MILLTQLVKLFYGLLGFFVGEITLYKELAIDNALIHQPRANGTPVEEDHQVLAAVACGHFVEHDRAVGVEPQEDRFAAGRVVQLGGLHVPFGKGGEGTDREFHVRMRDFNSLESLGRKRGTGLLVDAQAYLFGFFCAETGAVDETSPCERKASDHFKGLHGRGFYGSVCPATTKS